MIDRQNSISTVDDEQKSIINVTEFKQIENSLIHEKIIQMIAQNKLTVEDGCISPQKDKIMLFGPETSVLESLEMITSLEQKLKSELKRNQLKLNQQELKFYNKNEKLRNKMLEFCKKNICTIEVIKKKGSSQNLLASKLSYEGKELNIICAEIQQFPCDAIVNSCDNLMSLNNVKVGSGVAKNIFDMAGPNYTEFCESYIKENKTLEFGKAITYTMPGQMNQMQKYIINVSTPIYQNGEQTNQDFLKIEQNIKAIFVEANKLNIQTLALPIFGGGASGYSFKLIAQNVLIYIINAFYSLNNQTVQKVYIAESKKIRITDICEILKKIVETPKVDNRQVKYQWQWELKGKMIDYDDEDINRQINEGYEQFLNEEQTVELKLEFPFTKQPGTHNVDLKTMIIKDKDLNHIIKLSLQTDQGNDKFLFDNQEIEDVLNEYLIQQKQSNNHQFQIFYKQHKIIFDKNGTINQFNQVTNFKRQVAKIPYENNNQQILKHLLIGKQVQLKVNIDEILKYLDLKAFVESFDQKVFDDVQNLIQKELNKNKIDHYISLPLYRQNDFNQLNNYFLQKSFQLFETFENGKKNVRIQLFKKQLPKFQQFFEMFKADKITFPEYWIPQIKNSIKIDLPNDSQEYKDIEAEFKKTDNKNIIKIFRLQNYFLWENYHNELQKLRKLQLERGNTLTDIEQERYLWHGVKKQHPKIIYESMKEAFDITYSNNGTDGMYFAEKACYSTSDYSYTLTQQDDPIHAGKKVLLCCKVATGRIHTYKNDNEIKRPPEGYDCVSGFTNGSNVFILYGMDARRFYPAYEIIFG